MSSKKFPVELPIRVIDETTEEIKRIKRQFRGITEPVGRVNRSLKMMKKELSAITEMPKKIGRGMQDAGKKLAYSVGAPTVGAGVSIFNFVGRYQDELIFLKNITGATTAELEKFDKTARKVGQEKQINALDAMRGLVSAKVSGTSKEDLTDILPDAVDLSITWKADLAEAAGLVGTIREKTGRSAKNIVDIISTSMLESNIRSLEEFKDIYKNVGESFNLEGMSLEEFGVAATLVGQAMKGNSEGGTHLKTAILRLAQGNSEVKKALAGGNGKIGISPSDFLDENFKISSFEKLAKTFSQISDDTGRMGLIFGADAAVTMQSIFNNGLERYQKLIEVQKRNMERGVTGLSADAFMEGPMGKWRKLVGSVGELMIRIGKDAEFNEMIGGYIDDIRKFVDDLAGLDTESLLLISKIAMGTVIFGAGLAALGGFISLMSGAIGPLIMLSGFLFRSKKIRTFISTISSAGKMMKFFRASLLAATIKGSLLFGTLKKGAIALAVATKAHPMIALVSLLAAGAYLVYDNWDTIFSWLEEKWKSLKETASELYDSLTGFFGFGDSDESVFDRKDRDARNKSMFGLSDYGFSVFSNEEAPDTRIPERLSMVRKEEDIRISQATRNSASLSVDFTNMPKGVKVEEKENTGFNLDLNQGYALRAL